MPDLEALKLYPPVGRCIYCGASEAEAQLTDEHIIPFALAGNSVLPKASCKECARITGAIVEQQVLRRMFGLVRAQRDLPTRRPKERPKKHVITVDLGTHKEEREEDLNLRPRIFSIPAFPFPTILADQPADESGQISGIVLWTFSARGDFQKAAERHPDAKKLTIHGQHNPSLFARMLAKIAHSFAVAEYGFSSVVPLLPPLILGKTVNDSFNHLVGSLKLIPPKSKDMTEVRLIRMRTYVTGKEYLVAEIRIFGDLGMPVHLVVVGASEGLGEPLHVQQRRR